MKLVTLLAMTFTAAAAARADYPPYRYVPVRANKVVLIPPSVGLCGGNENCRTDCGCVSGHRCSKHQPEHGTRAHFGGGRLEYAPYRYAVEKLSLPAPPGVAGRVDQGELTERLFMDLQPRYPYVPSPGSAFGLR